MAATSIFDMANAVQDLALLEQKRLVELDELTIRQGHNVVDGGLAGLRILTMRAQVASQLLRELAPHEEAFRLWMEVHRARSPNQAPQQTSASPNRI